MKNSKQALSFLGLLSLLVSCQKEEIETNPTMPIELAPITRADVPVTVIPSGAASNLEDPIRQMVGIPVWVYLSEGTVNANEMYLNAQANSLGIGTINLSSNKNSSSTKWYLDEEITTHSSRGSGRGGSSNPPVVETYRYRLRSINTGTQAGAIVVPEINAPKTKAVPIFKRNFDQSLYNFDIGESNIDNRYKLWSQVDIKISSRQGSSSIEDLKAVGNNSTSVEFDTEIRNSNYLGDWNISPVEEFDLIEVLYDFLPEDRFAAQTVTLKEYVLENNTDSNVQRTITLSETITEESTYSKTEKIGVNITVESKSKVKIPLLGAESELRLATTTSSEWTFAEGERETHSRTISVSDIVQVPPHTTLRAQMIGLKFESDITYVAKLRGRTTGRIVTLTGKWENIAIQEERLRLEQEAIGE